MSMLPITHPIGDGELLDWGDLNRTRQVFRDFRLYKSDQNGPMLDGDLVDAIKVFQRTKGLVVDGIMNPAGETENEIFKVKTGKPHPNFGRIKLAQLENTDDKIGFGGNTRGVDSKRDPHHPDFGVIANKPKPEKQISVPTPKPDYKSERNLFDIDNKKAETHKEFVDNIEKKFKEYVEVGKENNLPSASRYLEHYLDGRGSKINVPKSEIDQKPFLKKGAEKNAERLKDSFLNKEHDFNKKIKNLREGETVNLKDHWDYKFSPLSPVDAIKHFDLNKNHILSGRLDEMLSTGNSHIQSSGDLFATKTNGKIIIEGIINHNWNDVYDFTPLGSFGAGATTLEKFGRAKRFPIESLWKQKFKTTIVNKDGQFVVEEYDVKDIK